MGEAELVGATKWDLLDESSIWVQIKSYLMASHRVLRTYFVFKLFQLHITGCPVWSRTGFC